MGCGSAAMTCRMFCWAPLSVMLLVGVGRPVCGSIVLMVRPTCCLCHGCPQCYQHPACFLIPCNCVGHIKRTHRGKGPSTVSFLGRDVFQPFHLYCSLQTGNYSFDPLPDMPADFGPRVPPEGVEGVLVVRFWKSDLIYPCMCHPEDAELENRATSSVVCRREWHGSALLH